VSLLSLRQEGLDKGLDQCSSHLARPQGRQSCFPYLKYSSKGLKEKDDCTFFNWASSPEVEKVLAAKVVRGGGNKPEGHSY
jgi:hypothetical protein